MHPKIVLHPADSDDLIYIAWDIRYRAYRSVNAIEENEEKLFRDAFDEQPNTRTYLAYAGEIPVGSIRACLSAEGHRGVTIPAQEVYPDVFLDRFQGKPVVESNRFVIDPDFEGKSLPIQMALFRGGVANAAACNADYILAAVRSKQVRFYERLMEFKACSESGKYPGLGFESVLMSTNFKTDYDAVKSRDPRFLVEYEEIQRLTT